jgi:hypothetical protein
LWDAGRIVPAGVVESFTLSGLDPGQPVALIVRAAPVSPTVLKLEADPNVSQVVTLPPRDGWLEQRIELGKPGVVRLPIRIAGDGGERVLFHVWAVQPE